jgi:magnesium transporter
MPQASLEGDPNPQEGSLARARTTLFRRQRPAPGSSPGTLVPPEVHVEPRLRFFRYGPDLPVEEGSVSVAEAAALRARGARDVLWIDVQGLGDGSVVRILGEAFDVHALAQADIVNLGQRPKADEFIEQDNMLIIARMLTADEHGGLRREQVSILNGPSHVLTFQETYGDCLDPLRGRIRGRRPNLLAGGADYLAVQVLDSIVDGYFPVLDRMGERLEELELGILTRPRPELLQSVYTLRRGLMAFRRSVWPLRDAVGRLLREEETIDDEARLHLRDVSDHLHQVVDVLETYREIGGGLVEIYLSTLGQRTNEVVRVLTVVSAIFIPLTFLAGIYGMNFDPDVRGNMPELRWPYAYWVFWGVCLAVAGTMLGLFWRLGWLDLGRTTRPPDRPGPIAGQS